MASCYMVLFELGLDKLAVVQVEVDKICSTRSFKMDDMHYQLEGALSQGFHNQEEY